MNSALRQGFAPGKTLVRAHARPALRGPMWPAPITAISNCPASYTLMLSSQLSVRPAGGVFPGFARWATYFLSEQKVGKESPRGSQAESSRQRAPALQACRPLRTPERARGRQSGCVLLFPASETRRCGGSSDGPRPCAGMLSGIFRTQAGAWPIGGKGLGRSTGKRTACPALSSQTPAGRTARPTRNPGSSAAGRR